jgi:hypothetical protein
MVSGSGESGAAHTGVQDILEADIKRRIRERSKCHPLLARNVLRTPILVPYRILDLHLCQQLPLPNPYPQAIRT